MERNMQGNRYNTENSYAASHENYRPKSDSDSSENWFTNHQKLLWGIGGAVVLGAGAYLLLKNKNVFRRYSNLYDEMNTLNQDALSDNFGKEEMIITTITELE